MVVFVMFVLSICQLNVIRSNSNQHTMFTIDRSIFLCAIFILMVLSLSMQVFDLQDGVGLIKYVIGVLLSIFTCSAGNLSALEPDTSITSSSTGVPFIGTVCRYRRSVEQHYLLKEFYIFVTALYRIKDFLYEFV